MPGLLTTDMPGTPGAITQMLGLLMQHPAAGQPGQPPPPPVAPTPMPAPEVAMQSPQESLLGRIHDYISDRVGIKEPGGYRGLLSAEEIQSAKPGILAAGAGDSWRENLNHILQAKAAEAQGREQQRVMQARAAMPQDLDLPGMLKYAAQHGDMEMIKSLGGPLEGMLSTKPNAASANIKEVPGVGAVDFTDPAHPKVVMKSVDKPTIPNFTATPGVDPATGQPTVFTLNTRTGKLQSTGVGRPETDNPQQQLTAARATAGIAEMNNANGGLTAYEDKLINGSANIKGLDQFIGSVGDSFLLEDPKSKALQAAALTKLNHDNPELARYIRRGLSFAEGETGISQRPSDYRTKLAAFLSTASAGASPEMIQDIRSRRESILGAVNSSKLAPKGLGKPKLTQAQYDAGRARGHTMAEIAQHYDLSGVTRK